MVGQDEAQVFYLKAFLCRYRSDQLFQCRFVEAQAGVDMLNEEIQKDGQVYFVRRCTLWQVYQVIGLQVGTLIKKPVT